VKEPFVTTVPACTIDFYPTVLDLLDIEMPCEAGPIDGISLLPLIDGNMKTRPQPIPLVNGGQLRVVDNDYRFQGGRLFRFDEEQKKNVDVSGEEPEALRRLKNWEEEWRASVTADQEPYKPGLVTRVEGQATGSAPGVEEKTGPERVFDGSRHTKYCVGEPTMWVQVKLAGGPTCMDAYAVMSAKDNAQRDPQDWVLKGSKDGESWTVLDRRSGESFSHRCMRREFRISQPDDYSHYRLDVTRNHGADLTQFAELYLFERSGQ
jgi:hypothetical protein